MKFSQNQFLQNTKSPSVPPDFSPHTKRKFPNSLVASVTLTLAAISTSQGATRTWDGEGTKIFIVLPVASSDWDALGNWDNNALPANSDDVVFGTAFGSGTSIDLIDNRIVNSLTINTATGFSIDGGNNLTLTSGQLTRNDVAGTEGNHSIAANIILGTNGAFNINGSGTLTHDGAIQDGANSFGLTKSGNGVLILSGAAESYNGDTVVNGGTLRLGVGDQITNGAGFGNLVVNSGGTFDLAGFDDTINGLSGSGSVNKSVTGTTTLTLGDNNATATFSGTIANTAGTLNLTKTGTGTQTLSGSNTYTGQTTINGGILSISADANLGAAAGALTISNGATLRTTGGTPVISTRAITLGTGGATFDVGAPLYLGGAITGGTGITTGGNDFILNRLATSSNNAIGSITVNSGRFFVQQKLGNIDGSSISVGNGAIFAVEINAANSLTNTIAFASGAGLNNRLGTLSIGTNAMLPSAGTMIFNNDDQATTAITVNGNRTLTGNLTIQVGGSNTTVGDVTFADVISGSGYGITKTSTGLLTLSDTNTYTGATTVNGGTLKAGAIGAFGNNSAVMLSNTTGVTLDITGFNTQIGSLTGGGASGGNVTLGAAALTVGGNNTSPAAFGGVISGTGGTLTKIGTGALTLSGANTYTGNTSVSAGALYANNASGSATGTGAVSVAGALGGSGTIMPTGANGINVTGVLAPGASVSAIGNLTLNLGSTSGAVTMASGSKFEFELGISGADISATGTSDAITLAGAASGDFTFNGNTIDFKNTGANGFYKLFDTSSDATNTWTGLIVDGSGLITGGLSVSNLTSGRTGSLIMGGSSFGGTAGDIYLQVVPEPSAVLLAGIGSLLLLRRHRDS